jgi:arylsulfatase A-like enzyme
MPKLEQPLFMTVGFPGPHPPFDPTPEYAEAYMDKELPLPPVTEDDLANQPAALKALREHNEAVDHDSVTHDVAATEEQRHRQRAYYYANVAMIDEQVGKLLDALEANGYDDTVVIFTSDHGEMLGDHGHVQMWTMYDAVTNVPTLVWSPGRFEPDTVEDLVSLFDLGPTVLDLADAPIDESMAAESLLPALAGEDDWSGREHVFAEHARDGILRETEFMTMVRTDDWKLVHFVDHDDGQLFDLNADPEETEDLWDDPAHQETKRDLRETMLEWRIRTGVESAGWAEDFR